MYLYLPHLLGLLPPPLPLLLPIPPPRLLPLTLFLFCRVLACIPGVLQYVATYSAIDLKVKSQSHAVMLPTHHLLPSLRSCIVYTRVRT